MRKENWRILIKRRNIWQMWKHCHILKIIGKPVRLRLINSKNMEIKLKVNKMKINLKI